MHFVVWITHRLSCSHKRHKMLHVSTDIVVSRLQDKSGSPYKPLYLPPNPIYDVAYSCRNRPMRAENVTHFVTQLDTERRRVKDEYAVSRENSRWRRETEQQGPSEEAFQRVQRLGGEDHGFRVRS